MARWASGLAWLAAILAGIFFSFSRALVMARSALSIFAWVVGMAAFLVVTDRSEPSSWASASVVWARVAVARAVLRAGLSMRVGIWGHCQLAAHNPRDSLGAEGVNLRPDQATVPSKDLLPGTCQRLAPHILSGSNMGFWAWPAGLRCSM